MFQMFSPRTNAISCPEARQLVEEHSAQLLDVRTPHEHAQGSLPGSINIPLANIDLAHGNLDKTKPVIVFCRSGHRSANACTVLNSMGFDAVHDLGPITKYLDC